MRLRPLQPLPQKLLMVIKVTATAIATATLPKTDTIATNLEIANVRGTGIGTAVATANAETEIAAGIDTAAGAAHQTRRERPEAMQAVIGALGVEAAAAIAKTDTLAAIEMGITTGGVDMPADARDHALALLGDASTALEIAMTAVTTAIVVTRETTTVTVEAGGPPALIEVLETLRLPS